MLYIITVVHNRKHITEKFVSQLKKQTCQDYILIIVDDGSTDGTAEMAKSELEHIVVISGNGNLWWGGGLHKAYLYMKELDFNNDDMVFICNDDITIEDDFIEKGVSYVKENKNKLISGKGYHDIDGCQVDGASLRDMITAESIFLDDGEYGNYTTTRALFMSIKTYVAIGGMHPILLPHYRSDIEYVMRAARKGFMCVSFSDLNYIVHSDSTGMRQAKNVNELFSRKYINNPIYNLNFVLLTTPLKILPQYFLYYIKRKLKRK